MIQKMVVESWDGKSKIYAELDVVKKINDEVVLVRLWGDNYKELTYLKDDGFWKVSKENIILEGENLGETCNLVRGGNH
jgi:hypothetical protein